MGRFILEHWYIHNSRLIQNPVKYPSWRICSEPCITVAYLEAWHSRNPGHIQNIVKHLSWNIYSKPCITLTYSEPSILQLWYILKSKHSQNPVEYLRWSILLSPLTIANLDARYIQNFRMYRTQVYVSTILYEKYDLLLLNISATEYELQPGFLITHPS